MLTFALAVILLIITPGPGVLSTAGFGAAYGFKPSLRYVLGLFIGTNLVMLAVVSGLAAVVLSVPWLRVVLMGASVAYLLYLATKIGFAGAKIAFIEAATPPGILGGILLQAINPKAYAVITSVVMGFNYAPEAVWFELGTKILIANMIWIPMHLMWLWSGVRLHQLNLSQRVQLWINFAMAGGLILVVVLSALSFLRSSL